MNPRLLRDLLGLPLGALVCALLANALASPARRLAWWGAPQPIAPQAAPPASVNPQQVHQPQPVQPVPAPSAPKPTPRIPAPQTLVSTPPQASEGPWQEITSEEALAHFQAGARFLDARRSADYAAGHIAGAWNLPIWESDIEARITLFEAQSMAQSRDTLVMYCTGGDCQDSHMLASRLQALGYRTLKIYRDGFPDWVAKGRPTMKGATR